MTAREGSHVVTGRVVVLTVDGGPQVAGTWLTSNGNRRLHWHDQKVLVRAWRTRGMAAAREQAPGLRLQRALVVARVFKKTQGRYDPGNWYPTAKALVDGLVDAHVLPDDDWRHLDGPDMRHGGIHKTRAVLVLTITDLGDPL